MYQTICVVVKNSWKELFNYCEEQTHLAKLFKNSVIFRLRQLHFAWIKDFNDLNTQEQSVIDEFLNSGIEVNSKHIVPNYNEFIKMFTNTQNVDYFNDLPQQCSQQIIKEAINDFKSFFKSSKAYKNNPTSFSGKPKIPKYSKTNNISYDITNQDAVIYTKRIKKSNGKEKEITYLKLPKIKFKLPLGNLKISRLKEVTVKPFYNTYKICIAYEDDTNIDELTNKLNKKKITKNTKIIGIDLGLDNIITISNNYGETPFIVKGNEIKAFNQWYNKTLAYLKSKLPKNQYTSKKIQALNKYRNNRLNDYYNKIANFIVNYSINNKISVVVIGKNSLWKSECNIGKVNNQNFIMIAHNSLIEKIEELALKNNIKVIVREESYTSKASFLDNDNIPVYKKENEIKPMFSGNRIKRGLYKTKNGIILNADVNGASNIIKKEYNNAFNKINDFSYLYKTTKVIKINL